MTWYRTNYRVAADWLRPGLIVCNDVTLCDPSVYEDFAGRDDDEVMQWVLTSLSSGDVKRMREHFPQLKWSYSVLLDLFVLCVDFCGLSWEYVETVTDLREAAAPCGGKPGDVDPDTLRVDVQ